MKRQRVSMRFNGWRVLLWKNCSDCRANRWQRCPLFFHDTGGPRGDDRRVISGIPAGLHHGEQWNDVSNGSPPTTRDKRFLRLRRLGVFARLLQGFAPQEPSPARSMIAATRRKAQHTAASWRQKGMCGAGLAAQQAAWMKPCMVGGMAVAGQSACC